MGGGGGAIGTCVSCVSRSIAHSIDSNIVRKVNQVGMVILVRFDMESGDGKRERGLNLTDFSDDIAVLQKVVFEGEVVVVVETIENSLIIHIVCERGGKM